MIPEGTTAVYWFSFSCILTVFGFAVMNSVLTTYSLYHNAAVALSASDFVTISLILILLRDFRQKIAMCSSFLGSIFAMGLLIAILLPRIWAILGWYFCFLGFFHFSEFMTIAVANPASLSVDSFMLNHSLAYGVALLLGWLEYSVEMYFVPDVKKYLAVSIIGFGLCLFGEILRKTAMVTASTNFHHIVQTIKKDNHHLVTYGIYRICRHPGYVGWFLWAIGTQLILVNPFCLFVYILCSWKFFHDRILMEEITLVNFFGDDYLDYKKSVMSGLPFIWGYKKITI